MPRKAIGKQISVELSSDSSLSSPESVDEENAIFEGPTPATADAPMQQVPKSRKRGTQALTNVNSPRKRIKIAKVEVFEESLERLSPTSRPGGTRKAKIITTSEVEINGVQAIESSILLEESETKHTSTKKRSKARNSDTAEDKVKIKKTGKKLREAEHEGAGGEEIVDGENVDDTPKKVKRRRKTKEEKEAEAMPLAARTVGLQMFIGAHVSAAKGSFYAAEFSKRIFCK